MEKVKEFFKKFKTVDIIIIACVIIALIVGFITFKGYRQTADKKIEATLAEIRELEREETVKTEER